MKTVVPNYYKNFACIAGRCRHSCCVGWEIDIDPDTYEYYKAVPGEFGDRLRRGISHEDVPCFKLYEGERCVFLNDRGLCDIILNLGEDALCDICTDHPRFRNFFSDRTEMGLGLCCEEACRIILGWTDPVELLDVEDDGEDMPDTNEAEFFSERQRILGVLSDESVPFCRRLDILSAEYGIDEPKTDIPKFYRSLERLDSEWDRVIDIMPETLPEVKNEKVWENLSLYLVYRHSGNYLPEECVRFAVHTVKLLCAVCGDGDFERICDTCRKWSSEIEYSEENTDAVMNMLK